MPRLIFTLPPRHGKSSTITERFPAYVLDLLPWYQWIVGAYNEKFAYRFSRRNRDLIKQCGIELRSDSATLGLWETLGGGSLRAAGILSGVTGLGANGIILDDPVKNFTEANSLTHSDRVFDEFAYSFMPRLEEYNMVIITLTRWSEKDIVGRIQDSEWAEDFKVINLPWIVEDEEAMLIDPIGREVGQTLCPELKRDKLAEKIKKLRPEAWESLFQGRPGSPKGAIFKRDMLQYFDTDPLDVLEIVQSIDTGFKDKEKNDPSVITTWLKTKTGHYLVDVFRERLIYPDLKEAIEAQAAKWKPNLILIEDKASGISIIQDLKKYTRLPIVPVKVDKSKPERAHAASGQFRAGNIYIKSGQPWTEDYVKEMLACPTGRFWDQIDSTTQYINSLPSEFGDFIIV